MDFFFQDPNIIRVSPEDVRINKLQVSPQASGRQVKVHLELTPFMKRPNVRVTITSATGKDAAQTNILETMLPKLEFTMHLREPKPGSEYTIEAIVYYQRLPEPTEAPMDIPLPEPMIVDHHKATFVLPQLET